jgi:PAS domain-containing protein
MRALQMRDGREETIFAARAKQRQDAKELMAALRENSGERVKTIVRDALDQSGSVLHVVSNLLDTTRSEIEDKWYRGELGMHDERLMMSTLEAAVCDEAVGSKSEWPAYRACLLTSARPTPSRAIDNAILREDGWATSEVDLGEVVDFAEEQAPMERRLVVLVGDPGDPPPQLRSVVSALHAMGSRVLVAAPGHWTQAGRWQHVGADACADNARTLVLLARKLHSTDTTFSISEVAASLNVTPHAIRAWERRYRLPTPARDRSGQRRYAVDDVQLLFRVSHAATVRGHSLRLAAMEAQGLLTEEVTDVAGAGQDAPIHAADIQAYAWLEVADAVPDMLLLVDGEGRIVDCNVATARLRDTVRENLRQRRLADLVIDYDRAKAVRLYRPSVRRRDAWELRMRTSREDRLKVVSFDSRVVETDAGRLLGLIGHIVPDDSAASAPKIA